MEFLNRIKAILNFAIDYTNMNKYKLIINKIFIELYFVNYNLNIKKFI